MTPTSPHLLRQLIKTSIKKIEASNDQIAQTRGDGPTRKKRKLAESTENSIKGTNEVKEMVERQVQDHVECYAQATCTNLCQKVITRLPRELRDLVYEHLITPDIVYVGPQYLTNEGRPCEKNRDAHHWDTRYVGYIMAVELAQTWYRLSLFYFWQKPKHREIIERFMMCDRWNFGIKPYEHISRVRFDLGDDVFHSSGHHRSHCGATMANYPAKLTTPFKVLAAFRFPNRVRFLIRIHTYGSLQSGCLSGGDFHHTLEEIIASLEGLQSHDHRFTAQWSELGNLEFTSADCELSAESWEQYIASTIERLSRRGW